MRGQAAVAEPMEAPQLSTAEFWDEWSARAAEMECGCPDSCPIDHDNA